MATIKNGGNGAFSGKAGSFVGSSWKNISIMKGLTKKSNRPPSQKQLDQRARFAAVLSYLGQIKDILNFGFKSQEAGKATGFNLAIKHAINNAVLGNYPDFEIDHSQVLLSAGTLAKPIVVVNQEEAHKIKLEWLVILNERNSFPGDKLFVVLYSPTHHLFLDFENVATRTNGQVDITLPTNFDGELLHVYAFFQQHNSDRCSGSTYVGSITMNYPS